MVRYPISQQTPPWVTHAREALRLAMAGDIAAAGAPLVDMCQRHGVDTLTAAALSWIDTLLVASGVEEYGGTVIPAWVEKGTGTVSDADAVSAPTAWAGRLIAARAANDEAMYRALMDAVPASETGRYIAALLDIAATTLNALGVDIP